MKNCYEFLLDDSQKFTFPAWHFTGAEALQAILRNVVGYGDLFSTRQHGDAAHYAARIPMALPDSAACAAMAARKPAKPAKASPSAMCRSPMAVSMW